MENNINNMEIVGQERIKVGKYTYTSLCPKCGSDDKRLRSKYCKSCRKDYEKYRRSNGSEDIPIDQLIEFVKRINDRGGMASINEVFGELITLFYSCYQSMGILDQLKPAQQIELMWKYLNEVVSNWERGVNVIPKLDSYIESSNYQNIQKNYRMNNRDKIKKYQKEYRDRIKSNKK